jgi:L-fuculose-phosphate aldolase
LAGEVETLCRQYAVALQVGTPRVLEGGEIEKIIGKFENYWPEAQAARSLKRVEPKQLLDYRRARSG